MTTATLKQTHVTAKQAASLRYQLKEAWKYRALIWLFSARDIKVKYTQTFLGLGWVLISPLITVGVFTFVFGLMIKIPTDGLPYLMFYLVAIIPWYAFIAAFNLSLNSVESNAGLVSKIYFPRVILAASYCVSASVDYLIGYILITGFAVYFGFWSFWLLVLLPILLLMQMLFAMGMGMLLLPLSARFRDVKHMVPLAMQLYYFANPILYPISGAPEWIQPWYHINPMSVVILSYRNVLRGHSPDWMQLAIGLVCVAIVFIMGLVVFHKYDKNVADIL